MGIKGTSAAINNNLKIIKLYVISPNTKNT
jgi:hypothetical protein